MQHLAARAHDLVDGLDHVHGDADGARLVGDRAGDRLPDPPGGVGGEFVAAAILELIDRLHQADIAFLNQIKELKPAVRVFLGDGNHQAQIGLDHLLLRLARLALALLHDVHDAAELGDLKPGLGGEVMDLAADVLDQPALVAHEIGPALLLQAADAAEPVGVELVAHDIRR